MQPGLPPQTSATILRLVGRAILRVLVIVLVCVIAIIVVPRLFGYGLLRSEGGSMGEALPNGTLVITKAVAAEDVKNGDVIVVSVQGAVAPVIHRVVALEEENGQTLATTKGDANPSVDPGRFPLSDSVAVATFLVPYLGVPFRFVATPLGWLLAIALSAALIGFPVIRNIWDRIRNIWDLDGASATGREQPPPGARQAAPAETPEAGTAKPMGARSRTRPDRETIEPLPDPARVGPLGHELTGVSNHGPA